MSALPPPGSYRPPTMTYGSPGPAFGVHPAPAPGAITGKLRPSKLWIAVASVLMAVGFVMGTVIAVVGILDAINSVTECHGCVIPQAGTYSLQPTKTGRYYLYVEGASDASEARDRYSGLDVSMVGPDGRAVSVDPYSLGVRLSKDDVDVVAVAQFHVETRGTYRLTVASTGGSSVYLRVGTVGSGELVRRGLVGLLAGGWLFLVGAAMLIVTLVRRSRAKKERRRQLGPPPGLTPWGTYPVASGAYRPPMPWGTPPVPPQGGWHPPH